jgi:hypothetical protein
MYSVECQPTFRRNMLPQSSGLKYKTCSSKTSVDFQWTTRRCIPEDITPHKQRCENRKSYICFAYLVSVQTYILMMIRGLEFHMKI